MHILQEHTLEKYKIINHKSIYHDGMDHKRWYNIIRISLYARNDHQVLRMVFKNLIVMKPITTKNITPRLWDSIGEWVFKVPGPTS